MGFLSSLFPPSVAPEEAHEAIRRREAFVLDVREPAEWRAGRIGGSKNVPLGRLREAAGELDPARSYVAVCRTGARSRGATARLRRSGLDVVNLRGGMLGWARAGLPLDPRKGRVL